MLAALRQEPRRGPTNSPSGVTQTHTCAETHHLDTLWFSVIGWRLLLARGMEGIVRRPILQTVVSAFQASLIFVIALMLAAPLNAQNANKSEKEEDRLEELTVIGSASVVETVGSAGSSRSLDADTLELIKASHPSEWFTRVPGVWITRNSGQEHLTAIRSGVLTGAGACGEFLILENAVPVRPAGFCNVNGLIEVNLAQATRVEVLSGPFSSFYGGNGLHGVINAVNVAWLNGMSMTMDAGPYGYTNLKLSVGSQMGQLNLNILDTDGYRDQTGHEQLKLTGVSVFQIQDWTVTHNLSITSLDQETGGYVGGFNAYISNQVRRSNPNPEAYRKAWSARTSLRLSTELSDKTIEITPYARRSQMDFRQHFLPGQPVEQNVQSSGGVLASLASASPTLEWNLGAQFELLDGSLTQVQDGPATGSPFLVATRPPGTHYDYSVASTMVALVFHANWQLSSTTAISANQRLESLRYVYDNRHLNGSTKDNGEECEYGGCLYTRPADRSDEFANVAARFALEREWTPTTVGWISISNGFRPPQATELYRLHSGQPVADLQSESVSAIEVGMRGTLTRVELELIAYTERTQNLIFRDAEGMNVSSGKTASRGLEFEFGLALSEIHRIEMGGTLAAHVYRFSQDLAGRERIVDGNRVDTAPDRMVAVRWGSKFGNGLKTEVECHRVGSHYLNASNTARYGGHTVVNWRNRWPFTSRFTVSWRIVNLLDSAYAERADFAFGNYRYFPAMPRQLYAGVEWILD